MTDNALMVQPQAQAMVSTRAPIFPSQSVVESAWTLAGLACKSGMSKARNQADAFFVIMYGYELGVSQMTSLRSIFSVGGAPCCSGELMLALIRSSGKAETIKLPDSKEITESASVYMKRKDTGEEYTATFTIAQAKTAGLVKGGGNWEKYPKAMLLWRAVSICAKALFSDVIAGLYTLEEISPNTPVDETGAPVGEIVIEMPAGGKPPASELPATVSVEEAVTEEIPPGNPPVPPAEPFTVPPSNGVRVSLEQLVPKVRFYYDNEYAARGSLTKLFGGSEEVDKVYHILPSDTEEVAQFRVLHYRAKKIHDLTGSDVLDAMNHTLNVEENGHQVQKPQDWIKLGKTFEQAWAGIKAYVAHLEAKYADKPAQPKGKSPFNQAPPNVPAEKTDLDKFLDGEE